MSQNSIIETEEQLNNCTDECNLFTFNGEIHLAKVVKCYDGDTFYCIFMHDGRLQKFHIRMYGYDSCEMKPSLSIPSKERIELKRKAQLAKKRIEQLILNKNVYLFCLGFDKYGRILGNVKLNKDDEKTINDTMLEEGHGSAYFGGTKRDIDYCDSDSESDN